jgi:hypothetical protein
MRLPAVAYAKSTWDLTTHLVTKGKSGTLTPDEVTMLDKAYRSGETQAQFVRDIQGRVAGGAGHIDRVYNFLGLTMAIPEKANRYGALLTAYRAAREGKIINKER